LPRVASRFFNRARFAWPRETGVRIDDPKQLFCSFPAMEAFVDEQLSLVLLGA
jgi:hypothetical protein